MTLPVDHAVRERASTELGTSIALTAGAGAGKTSVLVRRVTSCLLAGMDPSRIAAITFTEKAAGEILHRVRLALDEAATPIDPQALTRITISTLHSFSRSLLVAEPLEAGWAPSTDLREQASVAGEVETWWQELRRRDPALAERIDSMCSSGQRRSLALALLDNRDLRPRVAAAQSDEELFASLQQIHALIESEAARCTSQGCTLLRKNDAFRAEISGWLTLPPAEAVRAALASTSKPSLAGGRAGDWPHGKERFKDALKAVAVWSSDAGSSVHGALVREMLAHVVPAALRNRDQDAIATYQDLLFRAADLLRDNDAVRHRLAGRFDVVLIDEVQDTDPLQAEVALLLAREASAVGPWTETPPRPGALFAVGDRQQSIYRFRRADVATWGQLSATVGRGGETLSLTQNFRSVPGVLDWVRQVFGDGAHPQVAWREPAELDPVVVIHASDDEIEDAVAWVSEVLTSGRVVDRESGELRAAEARDLLFLVPRWANADVLAQRLERAGIRADVDGGRTFFARDEVRLALALLSCLVEPGDTQSTALVLRGLFGLTLEDLARHVSADGSLRLTVPDPPPGPVGEALSILREIRQEAGGSLVDLLDRALDASGAAAAWVLRADAGSRFANLDKVRKIVRDEERDGGTRLAVLDRLKEQAYGGSEEELSLTEPDSAAARVTTIFKAKGLEAPIVVLLDMNKLARAGERIVVRESGEVLLKVSKDLGPPGWSEAAEDEKAEVRAEIQRLAYVAATRARDQVVLLHGPKRSIAAVYGPGVPAEGETRERVALGGATVLSVPASTLTPAPSEGAVFPGWDGRIDAELGASSAQGDAAGAARTERLALRVRAAKRASTRWEAATDRAARTRGRGRPLEGGGFGPMGARLGEALHRVMEHLDLSADREQQRTDATRLAPVMLRLGGIDDDESIERVRESVHRVLEHPILDLARRAKRHLKEVPFVTGDARTRVTGTIDLAFPLDEGETRWQVVDWKIHVPSSGPSRSQYDGQLALYAKAVLAAVSPCTHVETALVGPHTQIPAPAPADESLELVLDSMRHLLKALLSAGATAPEVGVVIDGGPEAELLWEQARVAVLDGPAEEVEGWTVFGSDVKPAEVLGALGVLDGVTV